MAIEVYTISTEGRVLFHPNPPKKGMQMEWLQKQVGGMFERVTLPWGELWLNEEGLIHRFPHNGMASALAGPHYFDLLLVGTAVLRKMKRCPGEAFEAWREKAMKRGKRQRFKVAGCSFAYNADGTGPFAGGIAARPLETWHYISFSKEGVVYDPILNRMRITKDVVGR